MFYRMEVLKCISLPIGSIWDMDETISILIAIMHKMSHSHRFASSLLAIKHIPNCRLTEICSLNVLHYLECLRSNHYACFRKCLDLFFVLLGKAAVQKYSLFRSIVNVVVFSNMISSVFSRIHFIGSKFFVTYLYVGRCRVPSTER